VAKKEFAELEISFSLLQATQAATRVEGKTRERAVLRAFPERELSLGKGRRWRELE
jgi:hypothetical protein